MTSHKIPKDLTQAHAIEISKVIKEEIGDNLFSVLVDESRDVSIAEQMAVIVRLVVTYLCIISIIKKSSATYLIVVDVIVSCRYVDNKGMFAERFLGLKHVPDTT